VFPYVPFFRNIEIILIEFLQSLNPAPFVQFMYITYYMLIILTLTDN
jgi:hypothetical protein